MNKKLIIAIFVIAALVCGVSLYLSLENKTELNKAYGNVDIRQGSLSFERSGKIAKLNFDEGDKVKKDDVLAVLDTQALDHQINISKAQCRLQKATLDEAKKGYREEEIKQAYSNMTSLQESYNLAILTNERFQRLYKSKSVSAQERDKAFYEKEQIKNKLHEANAKYKMLQAGNRIEDIEKAQANFDSCNENLNYLNYQKDEQSIIRAPFNGVIRTRSCEVGDMASSSFVVYELSMLDKKRVRIYLTADQLPQVKVGKKAFIYPNDNDKIEGTIAFISDTAMFTPKTVQTEALRAELVYEVRVDTTDENDKLRLGQPVTVVFDNE